MTFFKRSYRRADLHADIAGRDVEASAELIEGAIKGHRRGATTS
jgi:hypothetical protein